jgi:hypothetical protein
MKKRLVWLLPAMAFLVLLLIGCASTPATGGVELVSWTHTVEASEYTSIQTEDGKEFLIYRYDDERFNTTDWFDTWIVDWMYNSGGWSKFMPVMDGNLNRFLYDVTYNDGYVTWAAYTADLDVIVGQQLRFYWLKP